MPGLKSGKVPEDLRRMNAFLHPPSESSDAVTSVDEYLHFVYQFLATSLSICNTNTACYDIINDASEPEAEPLAETEEQDLNLHVAPLVELEGWQFHSTYQV